MYMQTRVHAAFEPQILKEIDREVEKSSISRAQWLSDIVSAWLRLIDATKGVDPAQVMSELRTTNETLWRENKDLKRQIERASDEAPHAKRVLDALQDQVTSTTSELEKLRSDMILLNANVAHAKDTITQKDQQISFLESHIANLVQSIGQLAIKPSQEEAKKKGWWQFWK